MFNSTARQEFLLLYNDSQYFKQFNVPYLFGYKTGVSPLQNDYK